MMLQRYLSVLLTEEEYKPTEHLVQLQAEGNIYLDGYHLVAEYIGALAVLKRQLPIEDIILIQEISSITKEINMLNPRECPHYRITLAMATRKEE